MGRNSLPKPFGIAPAELTNIKGLPDLTGGRMYFTEIGYSQSYPWVEISRSPSGKTVTLAKVHVVPDPEWLKIRDYQPGGFCGHVSNQGEQTWLYHGADETRTKTIRKTKLGWSNSGVRFVEGRAVEFYDYNY